MPLISVDLSKMRSDVIRSLPAKQDVKKALRAIGAAARAEWISQASNELKSSSRDYIQGIGEPKVSERSVQIQLTGALPNMVEQGWPETDLRTTVLRSPKAKTNKKGGKYLAVPFRHGVPGSSGANVGAPMPKPIYQAAKNLQGVNSPVQRLAGTRLTLDTPGLPKKAADILGTKQKEWHTTSIYMGMIKKVAMYGATQSGQAVKQATYSTFRTISSSVKNDPRSWLHPGIKKRGLAKKVEKYVREVLPKIFADAVKDGR